jgi:sec-independent protein translocase protein TatC
MPNPVLETAQQRASEEMTGMSFLAHLEELRRRIIHSALYVVAGFGVCWGSTNASSPSCRGPS